MNTVRYGVFSLFAMALVVLLSVGIEYIIESIDTMLVPCQHGSKYINGRCSCLNTPFSGQYCEQCECKNGFCMLGKGTTPSKSDYGCKCNINSKYWGYFCDQCNTDLMLISNPRSNEDIGLLHCRLYASNKNIPFERISDKGKPAYCFVWDKVYYNDKSDRSCLNCVQRTCLFNDKCLSPYNGTMCNQVCLEGNLSTLQNDLCTDIQAHGGECKRCVHGRCGKECQCDEGWVGEQCDQSCNCNGHGTCVLYGQKAGCVCTEGWYGANCDYGCGECNGKCIVDHDKKTAFCECKQGFRGKHCELECPGNCNGHGICTENATCECLNPYNPPSCNCTNALCNGGVCDGDRCKCKGNFDGQFCTKCKKNWYGPQCDAYCDEHLCKGRCMYHDGIQCICKSNSKMVYDGVRTFYTSVYSNRINTTCKECATGYYPSHALFVANKDDFEKRNIHVECQMACTSEMCNGGNCTDTLDMCTCPPGFDPKSYCKRCLSGYFPEGQCTKQCTNCNNGRCGPDGNCICDKGWSGSKCNIDCPNQCGNGTCIVDPAAEMVEHLLNNISSCQCDDNYYGEACQFTCPQPPWESLECNANGQCTVYPVFPYQTCEKDSDCDDQSLRRSVEYFENAGPFCLKEQQCDMEALEKYAPPDACCDYDWDLPCQEIPNCPINLAFTKRNLTDCAKFLGEDHPERCYEQTKALFPNLVEYTYLSDRKIDLHNQIKASFSRRKPTTNWCPRVLSNRMYVGPFDSTYALQCEDIVQMDLLKAIEQRKPGCRVIDLADCPSNCTRCTKDGCKQCYPGFQWNGKYCEKGLFKVGHVVEGYETIKTDDPFECLLTCNTTYASLGDRCICGNTFKSGNGNVYKKCTYSDIGCIDQADGEACVSDANCKNFCADKCCPFENCKICGSTECQQCVENAIKVDGKCVFRGFSKYVEASCKGIDDWCWKNPILFFGDTYLKKALTLAQYFEYPTRVIDFWIYFEENHGISTALIFRYDNQFRLRFYVHRARFVFETPYEKIVSGQKPKDEWINVVVHVPMLTYDNQTLQVDEFNNFVVQDQTTKAWYDEIVLHNTTRTKECIDIEYMFPIVENMAELCGRQYIDFGPDKDLDWNTYCLFSEQNETCKSFEHYQSYPECADLFVGSTECINKSFAHDWSTYGKIPGCNCSIDMSYCENRKPSLKSKYDQCIKELKNQHPGVCSAVKCNCSGIGSSGHACQLLCPIGSNGEPCGGPEAGYCQYTDTQKKQIESNTLGNQNALLGVCDCFDGRGSNCDMECRECHNKTNKTFVVNDTTYEMYNAVCDKGRGLCQCLAPFMGIVEEEINEWYINTTQTVIRYVYGTPSTNTLKIKMMQGNAAFMHYVSNESDVGQFIERFASDPSKYDCGRPCTIHDVRLLDKYAGTATHFGFDCKTKCPGTDELPCSGHGFCSAGQCICDIAPHLNSDAIDIDFTMSNSGWRAPDCSVKCPGFVDNISQICSGHGNCLSDGTCECGIGYTGDSCQFKCPGSSTCSGHGTCTSTTIHLTQKRLTSCKWSECHHGIRTRQCPMLEYQTCRNVTRWSECTNFHYRYVNNILQRRTCGSTQCDSLCQFCDSECFQCVENAVDIGYGCTCLKGYKKVGNQCKTSRRLRQTACPEGCICTNNKCTDCLPDRILIDGQCYPLPCPNGQRWNGTSCIVPQKDHFFVPVIRKAMHDAICSSYTLISSGNDSIDDVECKHYADTKNLTFEYISNSTKTKGCFLDTTVFFNDAGINCSSTFMCIQRLESSYNDSKTNTCMDVNQKPFVKIDMYFDKNSPQEISQQFECQILDDLRVECPKCVCFDDDRHGHWDSFGCDRCQKGYGNSQCNQVCPAFDGVNEQSMCNYPHGMCQFGTIQQGNLLEHPPVQCMCGERGQVGSGIERVEVNNQYKYEMVVKNVSYSAFGIMSSQTSRIECDFTKKIDECFHFDLAHPCTRCESGWSGENCRHQCDKCFHNGQCNENPSLTVSTCTCTNPSLWGLNCCPAGFVVEDIENFDKLSQFALNNINIPSTYTNAQQDMSYWCKACPGVEVSSWLKTDIAKNTACGGPMRGTCGRKNGRSSCTCNTDTNGGYRGFNCRCKDSLEVGYVDEQTDYGCFGIGTCADENSDQYKYKLIRQDTACFINNVNIEKHTLTKNTLHEKIEECALHLGEYLYFAIDTNGGACEVYIEACDDNIKGEYNMYTKTGYFLYKKDKDYPVFCNNNGGIYYENSQVISDPGFYVPEGPRVQQYACLKGYYQPKPGESECIKAPMGSYVDTYNASIIQACPPGKYSIQEGATSASVCQNCDAGKTSQSHSCTLETEEETDHFCYDTLSVYDEGQCSFGVSDVWAEAQYVRYEKTWSNVEYVCDKNTAKKYYGGFSKCLTDCYRDTLENSLTCTTPGKAPQTCGTSCSQQKYDDSEMTLTSKYLCIRSYRECGSPVRQNITWQNFEYTVNKVRIIHQNYLKNKEQECIAKYRSKCHCHGGVSSNKCYHCNAGSFNANANLITSQNDCTNCDIGKYQDETGAYACKDCPVNQYQNEVGKIACKACSSGKYLKATGSRADNCCPEGGFLNQYDTCQPCPQNRCDRQWSGRDNGAYLSTTGCKKMSTFLHNEVLGQLSELEINEAGGPGWARVYIGDQLNFFIDATLKNPYDCFYKCLDNYKDVRPYFVYFGIDEGCRCFANTGTVETLGQQKYSYITATVEENQAQLFLVVWWTIHQISWKDKFSSTYCNTNSNTALCKSRTKDNGYTWSYAVSPHNRYSDTKCVNQARI